MIKTTIGNISQQENQEVVIEGWLYNKRSSGKIQFLQLRDGTGFIQGVAVKNEVSSEVFNLCKELTQESAIRVFGIVRKDDRAPSGYELTITNLELVSLAMKYPISLKEHGIEFLMDHRHLWLRSKRQHAILKVRAAIGRYAREFLDNRGFTHIDSPIITSSAPEDSGSLFEVDYFGEKAYLAQTGQLYAEAAAMAFGSVYTFGPTFRAEKSKTRRHLNEFWMLEPEVCYLDHEGSLKLQEDLIEYIVQNVIKSCTLELKTLGRDIKELEIIKAPFPRITYDKAVEMLKENGMEIEWGEDFGAPHEIYLSEQFNGLPVFVTHYPKDCKAFYMEPDPDRPDTVKCADLLYPGFGEIIGGSERIHDLDILLQRIQEENLPMEVYDWYADLRKYGTVPHSGFGLGLERMTICITGVDHIREAIPFARTLNRITP
ncbi:MAG TPA: asparagine--tRNA ligase [Eubacteriaceae bacterium]|nr:asparagine--tRNA ligase [Eubacteriaceae bacterium]